MPNYLMKHDVDYIVKDGEILIVDSLQEQTFLKRITNRLRKVYPVRSESRLSRELRSKTTSVCTRSYLV